MSDNLVLVEMMYAETPPEQAAILLQAPVKILLTHSDDFLEACRATKFALGADYLIVLISTMSATRGRRGEYEFSLRQSLNQHTEAMANLANTVGEGGS